MFTNMLEHFSELDSLSLKSQITHVQIFSNMFVNFEHVYKQVHELVHEHFSWCEHFSEHDSLSKKKSNYACLNFLELFINMFVNMFANFEHVHEQIYEYVWENLDMRDLTFFKTVTFHAAKSEIK